MIQAGQVVDPGELSVSPDKRKPFRTRRNCSAVVLTSGAEVFRLFWDEQTFVAFHDKAHGKQLQEILMEKSHRLED